MYVLVCTYHDFVSGDGRMDSPGFCAKYCTYTIMDCETLSIVGLHIVDKRQTELKSVNMEPYAFKQAMQKLVQRNINVTEVVTDAHITISAFMSEFVLTLFWIVIEFK